MKRTMKRLRVPGMLESSELPIALRGAYLAMHRRTDQAFAKYGITADQFVFACHALSRWPHDTACFGQSDALGSEYRTSDACAVGETKTR